MLKKKSPNKNNSRNLITRDEPRSPVSEQFRTIRTNIQYSSVDESMQVIMGTSAGAAEGKTTVNTNLAITMSQQGGRVLLIDADLRKPSVHYKFELSNHIGLTSIITSQRNAADTIQTIEPERLDVLSSGPIPPNPSELLGSKAMAALLEELRDHYEAIIFDTPPILAVTDGQIISRMSDGVFLIINSGRTERESAKQTVERLTHTGAKMLGVIINREKKGKNNLYYYGN